MARGHEDRDLRSRLLLGRREGRSGSFPGVVTTAVGYAGGTTPNPTYEESCTGRTGHAEVVLVAYDPARISYEQLLKTFWEDHDPTQVMRQGNDVGTAVPLDHPHHRRRPAAHRRSVEAMRSRRTCRRPATATIATEIASRAGPFYYAEDYHQQYLDKNPRGYCPIHSTGVTLPADFKVTPLQYVE